MAPNAASGGGSRRLVITLKLPSDKLSRFQFAPLKRSASASPSQQHKDKKVATGLAASSPDRNHVNTTGDTADASPTITPTVNNNVAATPEPTPAPSATITTGHAAKMGPKSSMGVINAGLRALDRSGKPCRKWIKSPLTIKGLAGYTFTLMSWAGTVDPTETNENDDTIKKSVTSDHASKKTSSSKPKSRLASSTTAADIENDSIKIENNGVK